MAVQNPPIFVQEGSHPAEDTRRALEALAAGTKRYSSPTAVQVTERSGSPSMSVDVATGGVWVPGSEVTYQGSYFCDNRGVTNLAISSADATNPRIDIVVAKVEDSEYSGAVDQCSLAVVAGTAAASPVAPSGPANSIVLAEVTVPALASQIVNSNITDKRDVAQDISGNLTVSGDASIGGNLTLTGSMPSLTVTGTVTGRFQPKFALLRHSGFTLTNNFNTTPAFTVVADNVDPFDLHEESPGSDAGKIVVDEDGVYLVYANVYSLDSSNRGLCNIMKNGTIFASFDSGAGVPCNDFTVTAMVKADAGDTFQLQIYHNHGSDVTADLEFGITLLHSL